MSNSESLGFRIVAVIVLTIIAGFVLAVIIYFNQIKQGKILSTSEATSMLVIAGIIFAITIILWIWALVRLFFSKKDRDEYITKAKNATIQYISPTTTVTSTSNAPVSMKTIPVQTHPRPNPTHTILTGPAPLDTGVDNTRTVVPPPAPPTVAESKSVSTLSVDAGSIPGGPISADVQL